jgi:hypothetical protein
MRCGAADRVHRFAADQRIEIGAARPKRIIAWDLKFRARRSPAVLADGNARIERVVGPGSRRAKQLFSTTAIAPHRATQSAQ